MSDFDKEAERKRLREKYEREEEKREVTERMSELLLKGATMTNAHCQECGDPIFRYDGQEFCATCQRTIERDTGEAGDGAESNGDTEDIEVAAPGETRVQFGGDEPAEADDPAPDPETARASASDAAQPTPDSDPAATTATDPTDTAGTDPEPTTDHDHEPTPDAETRQPATPASEPSVGGDLAEATDSLRRSVTELARRAEATDDLGTKRDLLAATREAAEALSAVRDAGR